MLSFCQISAKLNVLCFILASTKATYENQSLQNHEHSLLPLQSKPLSIDMQ